MRDRRLVDFTGGLAKLHLGASGWEDMRDRRQSVTGPTPLITRSQWEGHFNSSYQDSIFAAGV